MLVVDGAYPMASSAIGQDRDLLLTIEQVRAEPKTVRKIEDASIPTPKRWPRCPSCARDESRWPS